LNFSQTIHRFYLHFLRYKTIFWITTFFISIVITIFGLFSPSDEVLAEYLTFMAFLGSYEVENPGYSFWILFMDGLLLGAYLQVIGIFIGAYVLPREKEGKDHLFSTPKSITKYFIENSLLLILLLGVICLPSYIITVILLIINNSIDTISSVTIIFVLAIVLALFTGTLTAFGTTITFSRSSGYLLGGFYFVFSIFIDLTRDIEGLKELRHFSLFSMAELTQNSLDKTWNEDFILLALVLCLILVLLSIIVLLRKDYLEGGYKMSSLELSQDTVNKRRKFLQKLLLIRKPVDKLLEKLGWRFAIFRDQLHASVTYFTIILLFITVISAYIIVIYGSAEEEMSTMLAGFSMPLLDAIMYNHKFDPSLNVLNYFIAYELLAFGWILFGIFLLIAINDVCFRDKKNGYSEITWVTPKSGAQIITGRTLAAIVSYIIIFFASFIAITVMEIVFGYTDNIADIAITFFAATWAYCILLVFFLSLTLFVPYKHAQKILLFGYLASILTLVLGFMSDTSVLQFLSPFGYFDTPGLLLGDINFDDLLPSALTFSIIAILFFIITIKYRVPAKDYPV